MKIPKSFKLFATTINIVVENQRCNDMGVYGAADYGSAEIILSTHEEGVELADDRKLDTFYHEKVHIILDSMNKPELSKDEQFVDVFAKLLRQSDETAIF
jgi:hypothetical protein